MSEAPELPPERSLARLRYLNTPTSNWAADRIEEADVRDAWDKITANIAEAFGPNYRPYQPDLESLRPGSIVRVKRA